MADEKYSDQEVEQEIFAIFREHGLTKEAAYFYQGLAVVLAALDKGTSVELPVSEGGLAILNKAAVGYESRILRVLDRKSVLMSRVVEGFLAGGVGLDEFYSAYGYAEHAIHDHAMKAFSALSVSDQKSFRPFLVEHGDGAWPWIRAGIPLEGMLAAHKAFPDFYRGRYMRESKEFISSGGPFTYEIVVEFGPDEGVMGTYSTILRRKGK